MIHVISYRVRVEVVVYVSLEVETTVSNVQPEVSQNAMHRYFATALRFVPGVYVQCIQGQST
jgi:hypothetical protein